MIPLQDAFNIFGVGIGQAEIIETGLVVSTLLVVSYRLLTRGKRYRRG
ncbi:MAG TPA: hypothetical protein VMT27_05685 [Actinomycetes bacterium]|nr:hypothetical protein [Actinomycetes bacterium]